MTPQFHGGSRVDAIYRYPVKSMLGESVQECLVDANGVLGDRAYALIDTEDGIVASAKNPRKWRSLLQFSAAFTADPVAGEPPPPVRITFPDGSVHRSDDPDIDGALSAVIGRQVRLVSEPPGDKFFEEIWPEIDGLAPQQFIDKTIVGREPSGEAVSKLGLGALSPPDTFFDISVLHVLTSSTLARLAELAPDATFDALRYRPNLVLDGADSGFVEDAWVGHTLAVGSGLQATVSMLTMRCVMTTLPQAELPEDRQTLRTIAKHNRKEVPGMGVWACAGVYADVAAAGTVRRGDPVQVLPR